MGDSRIIEIVESLWRLHQYSVTVPKSKQDGALDKVNALNRVICKVNSLNDLANVKFFKTFKATGIIKIKLIYTQFKPIYKTAGIKS